MKFFLSILSSLYASLGISAPETYLIDNSHTFPRFEYSHFGFSTQTSRFDKTTGTITIDRVAKNGSVDIQIETKSINTGLEIFNDHLKGEDFFDVEKFPVITFKSTKIIFKEDSPVQVDGLLTVKNVTKPVVLSISSFRCMKHPIFGKDACGANATTRIKRSDFKMPKYTPGVSDEVTLVIPIEATKE